MNRGICLVALALQVGCGPTGGGSDDDNCRAGFSDNDCNGAGGAAGGGGSGGTPGAQCSAQPRFAFSGTNLCLDPGQVGTFDVNWLVSFWGTQPAAICAYDGAGVLPRTQTCAAAPENAMYCPPPDDAIGWDARWLNERAERFGVFASALVIAHEWGHLNQNRLGLQAPSVFAREQFADCQAGYASAAAESVGLLNGWDLAGGLAAMCRDSGTNGWFDPTSHGDCFQRQAKFNAGLQGGRQLLARACGGDALQAMLMVCN